MHCKLYTCIGLTLLSLQTQGEIEYVDRLAQRHAETFPSALGKLKHYSTPESKKKLENTKLIIGKTDPFSSCGVQSIYTEKKNGAYNIVYCPTGYRLSHDFGEGLAYYFAYQTGLPIGTENRALDFMKNYHEYLSLSGFSILSREPNKPYPKLCDPLLFVYLYVYSLDPQKCATQLEKYKKAVDWMYYDEIGGAITKSKLKNALQVFDKEKTLYSPKKRQDFITDMRRQIQAGQWLGQLFHEFFHIINGDLDTPPKSSNESREREFKADEFAIKMIIFDDPKNSFLRVVAFNTTQAFSAASINSNEFERRLQSSYFETMKIIKSYEKSIPPKIYKAFMDDYEAKCKNSNCPK
ncbi:hypothetical protein ABXV19_09860 [Pseudomonas alkylphenolica]|uniref:hypothetical protein n=1 Tax=Pseudomonas alkylphenolica TaxID=237609 RepID=UPI003395DE2C